MELSLILQPEKTTCCALIKNALIKRQIASTDDDAATRFETQLMYLETQAVLKPWIKECIQETVVQGFKYAIDNNLSLDPNEGLLYLMPSSIQVGGKWVKMLEVKPTADGKISIAKQSGTILDNKRPSVTKNAEGKVTGAAVEILLPSISEDGRPCTRWETVEIDESDFQRLRKYSHNKNARTWTQASGKPKPDLATLNYANALYTSYFDGIDPEFARSKVVSVSLKKRGTNMGAKIPPVQPNSPSFAVEPIVPETKESEFTVYEEVVNKPDAPAVTATVITTTSNKLPSDQDL